MTELRENERIVGADRVLAVMAALADHPAGASLEEVAQHVGATKSTVHRALATLRRAGLVAQLGRGVYILGDEFYRLAFRSYAARPEEALVKPALEELARRFGETTHFAVLDGTEVVYRAKMDPPVGAIRLTSVVGGRNPAHVTGVGKVLLAETVGSEQELQVLLGETYERRTAHTLTTSGELWEALARTRERGFGIDDQESEVGVNCIALPVRLSDDLPSIGAISVSALAFRVPLDQLIARADEIRNVITEFRNRADSVDEAL